MKLRTLSLYLLTAIPTVALPMLGHAKPIAYVNETPITTEDIAQELDTIPEVLTAGRQEEIQKALIARLIQKRLVIEEAKKLNIEEDKTFQAQLKTLRENLLFNFVVAKNLDNALTPVTMQEYYKKHKENFTQPAVNVSHILVETRQEALNILEKLKNGENFSTLAKDFSRGPSAVKGGQLGWVVAGEMVQSFEDAAFALNAGQTSTQPLKTQFGWHIIFVKEKNATYLRPFAEVEEQIQQEMSAQFVKNYLQSLEQKAKIRYEAEK